MSKTPKQLKNSTDEQIKNRLKSILNLKTRIERNNQDILDGDVSPFFLALFGHDITLYSKVAQSINTTFGMSFYEQVCKILGESKGYTVTLQHKIEGEINQKTQDYLTKTLDIMEYSANRVQELVEIKKLASQGKPTIHPDSTVDVFIKTPTNKEIYIDITTVKPNKKEFRTLKRKILTWAAMRWSINPNADLETYIAIPYNPEGTTYSRHSKYYDRKDILVGDELWELVSGGDYNIKKLEAIFSSLSQEVKTEISTLIKR